VLFYKSLISQLKLSWSSVLASFCELFWLQIESCKRYILNIHKSRLFEISFLRISIFSFDNSQNSLSQCYQLWQHQYLNLQKKTWTSWNHWHCWLHWLLKCKWIACRLSQLIFYLAVMSIVHLRCYCLSWTWAETQQVSTSVCKQQH